MSHITHFYHLAALDYIDAGSAQVGTTGTYVNIPPWTPQHQNVGGMISPVYLAGPSGFQYQLVDALVENYVLALEIRRKAHILGAEIDGKHPCQNAQVPGGMTTKPSTVNWSNVVSLMNDIRVFIATCYLPDLLTVGLAFGGSAPAFGNPNVSGFLQGFGHGNALAWGAFPNPYSATNPTYNAIGMPLFARGFVQCPGVGTGKQPSFTEVADPAKVFEETLYSHYSSPSLLHPSVGATTPAIKTGTPASYTWHKNPRYGSPAGSGVPCEVGPIARMLATALTNVVGNDGGYVAPKVEDGDLPALITAKYPLLGGASIECRTFPGKADHLGVIPELGPFAPTYDVYGLVTTVMSTLQGLGTAWPGGNPLTGLTLTETLSVLFSTLGRHACRALEAKYIADAMGAYARVPVPGAKPWNPGPIGDSGGTADTGYPMIGSVVIDPYYSAGPPVVSSEVYTNSAMPKSLKMGRGLTEAPRGALGHWITTEHRRITNYQAVVPSTWNACGKDDGGVMGPIEQSILGTNVGDPTAAPDRVINNLLKAIHPFDICVACSVHVTDTKGKDIMKFTMDPDGRVTKKEVATEE